MRSYIQCKILASEKHEFKDKTNGEPVVYHTNFLRNDDNGVIECNSKNDYSTYEGQEGVAAIETSIKRSEDGMEAKLKHTLKAFYEGTSFDLVEDID